MTTTPAYERILALLQGAGLWFEHLEHAHVHTSHDAARVRGTPLEEAAKAIVLKTGTGTILFCVVSGHRRVDLKSLKLLLHEKNVALASPEEVLAATGCTVGSVPPFGNLFTPPLPVYADTELLSREHLVFSAGTHYHSIRMRASDWVSLVQPVVAAVGRAVESQR